MTASVDYLSQRSAHYPSICLYKNNLQPTLHCSRTESSPATAFSIFRSTRSDNYLNNINTMTSTSNNGCTAAILMMFWSVVVVLVVVDSTTAASYDVQACGRALFEKLDLVCNSRFEMMKGKRMGESIAFIILTTFIPHRTYPRRNAPNQRVCNPVASDSSGCVQDAGRCQRLDEHTEVQQSDTPIAELGCVHPRSG